MSKKTTIQGVKSPREYPKQKKSFSGYQDSTLLVTSLLNMGRCKFLIYPRKDKIQADGRCSLYARVTIDGDRAQVSLNIPVLPDAWDGQKQMMKGRDRYATVVNEMVEATKHSLFELNRKFILDDRRCTAKEFMAIWTKKDQKPENFYRWMRKTVNNQWDQDLISYNTYRSRDLVCRLLCEYDELVEFRNLDLEWLYGFKAFLKRKVYSPEKELVANGDNTINKYLKVLKTYVGLAMREYPGRIPRNPFEDFKLVFKHEEKTPLSAQQVRQLWELYGSNAKDVDSKVLHAFLFQVHTGLRISDLRALRNSDIKRIPLKGQEIMVIQKVAQKTARYGKMLNIPVPSVFAEYVRLRAGLIFDLPSEPRYNAALKKIGFIIGVKALTSHIARHTFATLNMHMGENPIVTMNLLGHSSLNTTRIYTHHVLQQHVDAIERLNELIENS